MWRRLAQRFTFDVVTLRYDRVFASLPGIWFYRRSIPLYKPAFSLRGSRAKSTSSRCSTMRNLLTRTAGPRSASQHSVFFSRRFPVSYAARWLVAWIVTRTDAPLRGLGYFTAFASFGTPFILYTIGWLLLFGKAGPINSWLKAWLDQSGPVINVYSLLGMIFIESLLWSPFVFLMLAAAFRSMDPSLEEASAACGARLWQTMRRVSLHLMLPAFFSVVLLIFIRSFESFEIPALVGLPGDIRVLTTSIYLDAQKLPPQYGNAGAFSVCTHVHRGGYPLSLLSPHPRGRPLPHRYRKGISAGCDSSRPLALPGGQRIVFVFRCAARAAIS